MKFSPIMYYVPGSLGALTDDSYAKLIAELGLDHLRGTFVQSRRVEGIGPDGGAGLLFAPYVSETPEGIGYFKDKQTWVHIYHGECDYWIGVFTGAPVKPESLQRKRQHITRVWSVTLADEQEWIVPLAGMPLSQGRYMQMLPERRGLDENGNEIKSVLPSLEELDRAAKQYHETFLRIVNEEISESDADEATALAVMALGVFYHVSRREVMLLGLLTDDIARNVCEAVIGVPATVRMMQSFEDAQKKTD